MAQVTFYAHDVVSHVLQNVEGWLSRHQLMEAGRGRLLQPQLVLHVPVVILLFQQRKTPGL